MVRSKLEFWGTFSFILGITTAFAGVKATATEVQFFPGQEAVDGSLVRVEAPESLHLKALEFEKVRVPFRAGTAYFVVPFNTPPGQRPLTLIEESGKTRTLQFTIKDGNYPKEVLKVPKRHTDPDPADVKRFTAEAKEVGAVYWQESASVLWDGPFKQPIDSVMTSPFGTKRIFNGKMQSFHQGLDLKAAVGTPIHAPAKGKVVLAKDLFFSGNTVILDHGLGLYTLYAHLSEIQVKKGQDIDEGAVFGLSGMTGRASGPHLHWGAIMHRAKFNPQDLLKVIK